ncbi:hypothetical protein AGMMS4957_08840 [Bacteroidia bacterium]|nr:hypothetical protein AGMMS4957_08840 [Bacteroidia bacterium]
MALEIKWLPDAQKDLAAIYDYLEQNYTEREINRFFDKLEHALSNIAIFPYMYRQSKFGQAIRQCVLIKQISLIYRIKEDRIEILLLFDNRQNPNRLEYLIKTDLSK